MATLVRWNAGHWAPLRELATVQSEMSRMMNGLLEGTGRGTQSWVPALDVRETETELVYAFDLPGVSQENVTVEVHDGTLTVSATREQASESSSERYRRIERRYGRFTRTVGLPQGVGEEAITASYVNGVLEIHVPKPEEVKPRRIAIGGEPEPETHEGSEAEAA
jgi:HSP20 family protein